MTPDEWARANGLDFDDDPFGNLLNYIADELVDLDRRIKVLEGGEPR